jgi:hypothetical protein
MLTSCSTSPYFDGMLDVAVLLDVADDVDIMLDVAVLLDGSTCRSAPRFAPALCDRRACRAHTGRRRGRHPLQGYASVAVTVGSASRR